MYKNEVFNLLKSFTRKDLKQFKRFLQSPYHNRNKKALELFNFISKFYPLFNNMNLNKETLFEKIFGGRDRNSSNLRNLFFHLTRLAQNYLIIEKLNQNKLDRYNYLLGELNIRGQKKLFLRNLKEIELDYEGNVGIDGSYFNNKYIFESQKYNFYKINEKVVKKIKLLPHIEGLNYSDSLITIYCITELICDFINLKVHSIKYNIDISNDFNFNFLQSLNLNEIRELYKAQNKPEFIMELYICLYYMYLDFSNEAAYKEYKNNINKYYDKLSPDEISFHYSVLIAYLVIKDNEPKSGNSYAEELFDVYDLVLRKEFYKNSKTVFLPISLYRGILFLGCRLKKCSWLYDFIKTYSSKVQSDYIDNIFHYSFGYYYQTTGEYAKALESINNIKALYFIYKFDVNNLKLKLFYELDYLESCLELIHSYHELLRKDQFLNRDAKTQHENFLKYLEKLILFKLGKSRIDLDYILYKLSSEENIIYKDWLLNKMNSVNKR
jgi:hypothetical protein